MSNTAHFSTAYKTDIGLCIQFDLIDSCGDTDCKRYPIDSINIHEVLKITKEMWDNTGSIYKLSFSCRNTALILDCNEVKRGKHKYYDIVVSNSGVVDEYRCSKPGFINGLLNVFLKRRTEADIPDLPNLVDDGAIDENYLLSIMVC